MIPKCRIPSINRQMPVAIPSVLAGSPAELRPKLRKAMKMMKKDFPLIPNRKPKFFLSTRVTLSTVFHHISSYVNRRTPKRIM